MGITHKAIAALAAAFLALFAGAAIILDRAVTPGFEQLEAEEHARDRTRVIANLDSLRDDLRQRAVDYAYWDDTYAFAGGSNPSYTGDYSDEWFADYGVDLMVVSNTEGQVFWALGGAARGGAAVQRGADDALAQLTRYVNTTREPVTGVTWLEGFGFAVYAAAPITMSDGSGGPRGVFIIAKRLSDMALSTQVQLNISLERVGEDSAAHMGALANEDTVTWTGRDELLSLIALRDSNGALVGAASARQPRDIAALGDRVVTVALVLFAAMSAVFALVLWLLLRLGVLRRLERMEAHFNAQGEDPKPLPTISAVQDEITRLIEAYNALIHRSGESARHARDAQRQRDAEMTANRMKSDFLANISHELRTPLNHVIGYAELIGEDLAEGRTSSSQADLHRITHAARHLLTLVNDILDLAKIEAGKLEMRPQAFDIAEMVREAVSVSSVVARERNCRISVDIQSGIGVAYSDQTRLRQSLISALAHACSSSEGSPVRLTARRMPCAKGRDEIELTVHCPSAALTAEELDRLFEPYADADALGGHGGAGLGLSVTRRVLGLLGGGIHASIDNGVTFILKAPVVLDDRQRAVA